MTKKHDDSIVGPDEIVVVSPEGDVDGNGKQRKVQVPRKVFETFLEERGWTEDGKKSSQSKSDGDPKPPTVDQIKAEVGDDKEKAQAALVAELNRGDDARSTLVDHLKGVIGE